MSNLLYRNLVKRADWRDTVNAGQDALRWGGDRASEGLSYMSPQNKAEMAALAGTVGATGILGGTARSLSPIGAVAPMFNYFSSTSKKKKFGDILADEDFHRAALFSALPLVGKLASDMFGGNRRLSFPQQQQRRYRYS